MKNLIAVLIVIAVIVAGCATMKTDEPVIKEWSETVDGKPVYYMTIDGVMVHETDPAKAPLPHVIRAGTYPLGDAPGTPPSDAIALFDGTEESFNSNWEHVSDRKTKWLCKDGIMHPVKKAGDVRTKQKFGSCQLHVEFATPAKVESGGQGRGNSGVFLMGTYEVQVLDSYQKSADLDEKGNAIYDNPTYADGQAGALYGRNKPLVNVCRKPGQWQSYDIIFHRPVFDKAGKVVKKATFTVIHNGVLIQDHTILHGGTGWKGPHCATPYKAHPDKLPLQIQNHGNEVDYRIIWIRELAD
ncbi:MAG: DUF1080 domain-containing protein [Phycisphaerae bacterium]|nr:DUF1080 domain-containing protein [Phycisphaerae bacterium]